MDEKRINMVAPCGIDCGICEVNTCRDDRQLFDYLAGTGIPKEKMPCAGCRNIKGDCPVINGKCETYKCASEKKVEFCFECNEFPCDKLSPCADRANILPHNTKVFNLCTIKKDGVDNFIKKSIEIKMKYYKGKMAIGKGPHLEK